MKRKTLVGNHCGRHGISARTLPSEWAEPSQGRRLARQYVTPSSGMSGVTSCASVSDRIHSSSSNCIVVGSFSSLKDISCVSSTKRHSSEKSPVAHLIVRMSRPRNRRLLWPAPAKETMASRCSGRSTVGRSTHWRQFDVGQRGDACFAPSPAPSSRSRTSLWRPPPQALRPASLSTLVG